MPKPMSPTDPLTAMTLRTLSVMLDVADRSVTKLAGRDTAYTIDGELASLSGYRAITRNKLCEMLKEVKVCR